MLVANVPHALRVLAMGGEVTRDMPAVVGQASHLIELTAGIGLAGRVHSLAFRSMQLVSEPNFDQVRWVLDSSVKQDLLAAARAIEHTG